MASMKNLDKVLERLARIPKEMQAAVQKQLEIEAADLVQAEKRAAPVSDLEEHPGQLRESIESYPNPSRPLSVRVIVGARDSKGTLYGRYVEFGHTAADGTYVHAQPFWFPTYRARRKGIKRRLGAAARKPLKTLFPKA